MLKWPNDLMLGGAKLAGILLERSGERVVAGFGVNLASAPQIEGRATADLGGAIAPKAFAPLLAASFARLLDAWRLAEPEAFARAWLARAYPVGTPLSVHGGTNEIISGKFAGIEPDGALRLDVGSEIQVIRAGDVHLN
jgi:BirA family biotin operon repressor/biotin-[acetyl-CoA-carboxylase] ligase